MWRIIPLVWVFGCGGATMAGHVLYPKIPWHLMFWTGWLSAIIFMEMWRTLAKIRGAYKP